MFAISAIDIWIDCSAAPTVMQSAFDGYVNYASPFPEKITANTTVPRSRAISERKSAEALNENM
jgi:hypothetical protein